MNWPATLAPLLAPNFLVTVLVITVASLLLGAAVLCWLGKISEAGYLTVTLAVGAGFGLSTQTARGAIRSAARGLQ